MRITKLEAAVESIQKSIELLQSEVAELRRLIIESISQLRDHTDKRIDEQRDRLDDLRKHVDRGFNKLHDEIDKLRRAFEQKLTDHQAATNSALAEMRSSMERGFAELRAEAKTASRWRWGCVITVGLAITGWLLFAAH